MNRNENLDYEKAIQISDGIYWIGFYDESLRLHCNPYLIVEGEEALVIDGGSRPEFSTVMMKILDAGVKPSDIKTLIYQHYDPDLCGSIASFEDIIDNRELQIISHKYNNPFIKHYFTSSRLLCAEAMGFKFEFSSGRELFFILTPYAHSQGSFVTFDKKTGTLFSSDIFGSFSSQWDLFLELGPSCFSCNDYLHCKEENLYCPLPDIINFHKCIMTSTRALNYALEKISALPVKMIAPQHGSVIYKKDQVKFIIDLLKNLKGVGIDRFYSGEDI